MLYDILKRTNTFQRFKNKYFKNNKIEIFPNGFMRFFHGFRQKLAIFPSFLLRQYKPGKCVLRYSRTEKALLGYKLKTRTSKSRKIEIFPKGLVHGFRQKLTISPSLFTGNIRQKNVFYDILERKNQFLVYTNKKVQQVKKLRFFQTG